MTLYGAFPLSLAVAFATGRVGNTLAPRTAEHSCACYTWGNPLSFGYMSLPYRGGGGGNDGMEGQLGELSQGRHPMPSSYEANTGEPPIVVVEKEIVMDTQQSLATSTKHAISSSPGIREKSLYG